MALILRNSLGAPLTFTQGDQNLQWLESGSLISASVLSSTSGSLVTLFRRSTSNTVTGAAGAPVASVTFFVSGSGGAQTLQDVTTLGNQTSASMGVTGSLRVVGNVLVTGSIYAQNLYVSTVSSSIIYESGSTKFGNSMDDTHQFTGSVSISGSLNATSSQALTASYVNLLAGPGIRNIFNDKLNNSFAITASVVSVNGNLPDVNGNVATSLTAVYVGDSGSFQVSQSLPTFTGSLSPGSIWVFANSTGSASGSNGQSFIYTTGSTGVGSWYPLGSANTAQYDARYLMLTGTNSPMQGHVNWGGYRIEGLGDPNTTDDAVNLGTLTSSLLSYKTTRSFDDWTGSYVSYFFGTSSNANTASIATSASYATSASFVNLIAGPGIRSIYNDKGNDSFTITASMLSVNGIFPDQFGNVSTALTAVYVGDSGSFQTSQSLASFTGSLTPGTIWVLADSTGSASGSNGQAFIYTTGSAGSGSWYPLGSSDIAQYDARYLMLDGFNSPMQGNVNFGAYQINNLADPTLSSDAVNLGTLTSSLLSYKTTQSFDVWTGSFTSYFFGTSSNADTASYIDVTGSGVLVNWNGTQLQLTASATPALNVLTSSLLLSSSISNLNFIGSGVNVAQSGSDGVLITITGGGGNLQDVTTLGNVTSRSIDINDGTVVGGTSNSTGSYTFTHGDNVSASGDFSHAQGEDVKALGYASHGEGLATTAIGVVSHTEGQNTTTTGYASHAEGSATIAEGMSSHAEGELTTAVGDASHAEGLLTTAIGNWSHTQGQGTIAKADFQSVVGQFNLEDTNAVWIAGGGLNTIIRKNIAAAYSDKFTVTGSLIVKGGGSIGGDNLIHLVPGPGIVITSGSTGYIVSASATSSSLQDVTTVGNYTTSSNTTFTFTGSGFGLIVSGNQAISGTLFTPVISASVVAPNFVNFVGTASWAANVAITASGIVVNTGSFGVQLTASATPAFAFISSSAPTTGTPSGFILQTGSLWWDDTSGTMYVYYCDVNGCQWVETNGGVTYNPATIANGFVLTSSVLPQTLNTSWTQVGNTQTTGSVSVQGNTIVNGFYVMSNYASLNFTDDTAAAAGGVPLGGLYRTGNMVVVRLT